jgi:hypothetical protein
MDILSCLHAVAGMLTLHNIAILVLFSAMQHLLRAVYNISPFHPLHQIPGPKLAAISYLYEFYFNVVQRGRYTLWDPEVT